MESASDVQDVLAVQSELERFQTEIEVLQGQIRYLEESAAYSLITVELSEEVPHPPDAEEEEEDDRWKPVQTAEDAFDALVAVLKGLGDVLIVMAIFVLPLSMIVGVPSWVIYKRLRPYFENKKPSPAPPIYTQHNDPDAR